MSIEINLVVISGRLTADPELNYTPNTSTAVCKFMIASDKAKPANSQKDPGANFVRVTVFGKLAETYNSFLKKGSKVVVQGKIDTGSYKDRDGKTVYTTDIIANFVQFDSNGGKNGNQMQAQPQMQMQAQPQQMQMQAQPQQMQMQAQPQQMQQGLYANDNLPEDNFEAFGDDDYTALL